MREPEVETIQADTLWDANEAARFLRVHRNWVYQRAEAGLLPHIRVAGLLRFEPATLRAFVRQDRVSSTQCLARIKATRS